MMKQRRQPLLALAFSGMLAAAPLAFASGEHGHDSQMSGHKMPSSNMDHMNHNADHKMPSGGMDKMSHDSDHKMHDGADHKGHDSKMGDMFLKKKEIDGYTVSFHIMKAQPGKEMGGSHNFMIKVEKDGKALSNIAMNTKVKHPSGKSETKKTMQMGDWQMAGYDLGHKGRHQMMILFKTADGKKHKGGVYYLGT